MRTWGPRTTGSQAVFDADSQHMGIGTEGRGQFEKGCALPSEEGTRKEGGRMTDERTLFGSLMSTYFPSGCFMHRSVTVRTMPQPLGSETFSWAAKSAGLTDVALRMT